MVARSTFQGWAETASYDGPVSTSWSTHHQHWRPPSAFWREPPLLISLSLSLSLSLSEPLCRFTSLRGSVSLSALLAEAAGSSPIVCSLFRQLGRFLEVSRIFSWRQPRLNHPSRPVKPRQRTVLRLRPATTANCQLLISMLAEEERAREGV